MSKLFAYKTLGFMLREKINARGLGYVQACKEMQGIECAALSRVMAGQAVDAGKVIAMCDWLDCDIRDFYVPDLAAPAPPKMFHVSSSEMDRNPWRAA